MPAVLHTNANPKRCASRREQGSGVIRVGTMSHLRKSAAGAFARSSNRRYQHRRHLPYSSRTRRERDFVRVSRRTSIAPGELGAGQPGSLCCCWRCPYCCCDCQPGSCWRCCSNCRRVSRGSNPVDETQKNLWFAIDDCRLHLPLHPFQAATLILLTIWRRRATESAKRTYESNASICRARSVSDHTPETHSCS